LDIQRGIVGPADRLDPTLRILGGDEKTGLAVTNQLWEPPDPMCEHWDSCGKCFDHAQGRTFVADRGNNQSAAVPQQILNAIPIDSPEERDGRVTDRPDHRLLWTVSRNHQRRVLWPSLDQAGDSLLHREPGENEVVRARSHARGVGCGGEVPLYGN